MCNPRRHWFRVPLVTRFRIYFMGLSSFRVTPVLLVLTHPHPCPVCRSFRFSISFSGIFNILGCVVLWCQMGGVFKNSLPDFSYMPPRICVNSFVWIDHAPNKILYLSLWFFFAIPFTIICATELSIDTGVGGFGWLISSRTVCMVVGFWQVANSLPH